MGARRAAVNISSVLLVLNIQKEMQLAAQLLVKIVHPMVSVVLDIVKLMTRLVMDVRPVYVKICNVL